MIRYILQRFFGMIVVMFLVVTIVFVIVRVTPGDPAPVMLGPDATPQILPISAPGSGSISHSACNISIISASC